MEMEVTLWTYSKWTIYGSWCGQLGQKMTRTQRTVVAPALSRVSLVEPQLTLPHSRTRWLNLERHTVGSPLIVSRDLAPRLVYRVVVSNDY